MSDSELHGLRIISPHFSSIDILDDDSLLNLLVLALEQRDLVRRICLWVPALNLQELVAIKEDYPILEFLIMAPSTETSTTLAVPTTLQAPHLHHLLLSRSTVPMGFRLLTTAVGLVALNLVMDRPCLLPANCTTPSAFIHALAGGSFDFFFNSLFPTVLWRAN